VVTFQTDMPERDEREEEAPAADVSTLVAAALSDQLPGTVAAALTAQLPGLAADEHAAVSH
jgi:hypothetical protein